MATPYHSYSKCLKIFCSYCKGFNISKTLFHNFWHKFSFLYINFLKNLVKWQTTVDPGQEQSDLVLHCLQRHFVKSFGVWNFRTFTIPKSLIKTIWLAGDVSVVLNVCFILALCHFQQYFSHITTVSGCSRELNAHFQSAASLKYHAPDTMTWYSTQSHYTDTELTSCDS